MNYLFFKCFNACRTFGGFANDKVHMEEHTTLWNSLSEEDRNNVKKTAHYYLAGYDAPFKLLFRRNEIWMIVKNEDGN